jgi:phosphinothricin acetyltransferase
MRVRAAVDDDLVAIAEIYNDEVERGTSTFDTEPVDLGERRAWLAHHDTPRHPVIVADLEGRVAGWASLSPWSERCAYARAAEISVYVHADCRGAGVGRALLQGLIDRARAAGLGVLLARIVSQSDASLRLHESLGFQRIGTMRRVGEKFGRVLDVILLDLHLD